MNDSRGSIMGYVLIAIVGTGLMILALMSRADLIAKQQGHLNRITEATMFMRGLANMLDYSIGCSNSLGYGYHTSTSAQYANEFNPDIPNPQNTNVTIYDPAGNHNVLYRAWSGDPTTEEPPKTALATPKLLIRQIVLQKNIPPGGTLADADLASFPDVQIEDSTFDPNLSVTGLVDVRAVSAELMMSFENIGNAETFFSRSFQRKIEIILYVERPKGSSEPWRVVTCTPNMGAVILPGWVSTNDVRTQPPRERQTACPQGSYAVGIQATSPGPLLRIKCAKMRK